ncbi:4-(cytidine 5'-diphospho)-2-C-methyl-D-erythritol kinase [Thermicanus aegyptius]|uniref:4-(cytidine 5'-diphospho)-2-C-methyl-D-erythritol kinase n=1 Tax=Thermicanus aegyptius TaxID=94009 RepID=UPI000586E365|nr:4-(cytidine 5'-diphospho)-2-C-methyl-D-erythritol kinase [Thermicanus aegyptius]
MVTAPAKINLTLDVLGKREDGYHEVKMVMTTIDLSDRLTLMKARDGGIYVASSAGAIPTDERNLAHQAALLLKREFQVKEGVRIYIEKNIPVAAGLAGGSSDAAAALKGLNQLWNLGLNFEQLAQVGARLGSDVPFVLYGGTSLATGRGEVLTPLPSPPPSWVVLAKPPIGVSTSEVYGKLRLDQIKERPDHERMLRALAEKDFSGVVASMGNVLETVTFTLYPEVKKLKERMIRFGGEGVLMSGSGPTIYTLVRHESRAFRVYNALRGFCKEVYMVRLTGRREIGVA